MNIRIEKTTNPKQKPDQKHLSFGKVFTDHMFLMNYEEGIGWHDPRIVPYGDFSIDPAACVLHYGAEIFEGLKAYRRSDGKIQLFRPEKNFERMNVSGDRLCMPPIDVNETVQAVKTLVSLEQDWVPSEPETSLYIRPFMFATEAFLGVHPPKSFIFAIILSPWEPTIQKGWIR